MLSTEQKAIIQQTVPILEAGGEALTGHFYRIMLRDHPEVRPLFNRPIRPVANSPVRWRMPS